MTRHSYFVSDLHMFARRSRAEQQMDQIRQAAADSHTFVLGGDIFDFKWSRLPSGEATVDAAIDWLTTLVGDFPDCQFLMLLGNHDSHEPFVERLEALATATPNLDWHPHYFRIEDCVFLHGDVADRQTDHQTLVARRADPRGERRAHPLRHHLYDAAVALRLPRLINVALHHPRLVANRLLYYLREIEQGPEHGVRHVYFGHTHAAVSNYEHEGVIFNNGGAPIPGQQFRIVRTMLTREADHD